MSSTHPTSSVVDKLLFDHPRSIDESYLEHAGHAGFIGTRLILSGLACLIHALLPGLFVRTASNTVDDINALMARRTQAAAATAMAEQPSN